MKTFFLEYFFHHIHSQIPVINILIVAKSNLCYNIKHVFYISKMYSV